MKGIRLLAYAALLYGYAALAETGHVEPLRLHDAVAMKDAADRLARCAGTYRGAAEVMRKSGREQAAAYAENVGFGALFAAYLLLTSPAAVEAAVLDSVDPNVHIEALAWATERNFVMMDEQAETAMTAVFKACKETAELQSSLLRGALPVLARSVP
jgi:hypothetical protein